MNIKYYAKEISGEFQKDDVPLLAAAQAYHYFDCTDADFASINRTVFEYKWRRSHELHEQNITR
ncbi:hypothetical protein ACTWQL_05775 [Pseudalkalibacillus sp. R45]|uniref:hypothetical protein n=1 Tax=Pseudalkalibacillus sp. R45 TaxID=3457433 RepID=UPI003FCC92ED